MVKIIPKSFATTKFNQTLKQHHNLAHNVKLILHSAPYLSSFRMAFVSSGVREGLEALALLTADT